MKSGTGKFLASVFGLTLLCAVLELVWNNKAPEKMQLQDWYWMLGMFAVTVTIVHLVLVQSKTQPGSSFITTFMVSTTLKFFFYLAVLLGFMLLSKDNKSALAIHFLFYYMAFNILEVTMLYKEVRK